MIHAIYAGDVSGQFITTCTSPICLLCLYQVYYRNGVTIWRVNNNLSVPLVSIVWCWPNNEFTDRPRTAVDPKIIATVHTSTLRQTQL